MQPRGEDMGGGGQQGDQACPGDGGQAEQQEGGGQGEVEVVEEVVEVVGRGP